MYKDILVDEAQELMAANLVSSLSLKLDGLTYFKFFNFLVYENHLF